MTYKCVNLESSCNASLDVLGPGAGAPLGEQVFHGLSFLIGSDPARCFIMPSSAAPTEIRLDGAARYVIVAHRLLGHSTDGIGAQVAEYAFTNADGESFAVPIRERFEIAVVADEAEIAASPPSGVWGQLPFDARSDRPVGLHARDTGPWGWAGRRQADVSSAEVIPRGYFLWTWENPRPEIPLAALTVRSFGPRFLVAAVTVSDAEEYPFARTGARPVKVLTKGDAQAEISVDRGVAGFTQRAASHALFDDALAGWGTPPQPAGEHASYARLTAIPSATVRVEADGASASVSWAELEQNGVVEQGDFTIRVLEPGRNWVRTTVVDATTNAPIPARIHFRSADGVPYQPHGHHSHVNGDRETWHIDVGGDVRLGQSSYAYIDGTCEGWLPRGDVVVDVAQGFEYEPLREVVTVEPGQQELTLRLRRWIDLNEERWFSGDSHVHFLSSVGSHTEAQAEGLNVVNLLLSQWGSLFTNAEDFTGEPLVSRDGKTIVYASQENRQHFLGHLTLLGLKRPVMPWASDGPPEGEVGGTLEVTLAHWADECHRQGGTVVLPHIPVPNGEPAALIATGRVDAVEFLVQSDYAHSEYYRYLNCGYRLPLVAGTDKMSNEVPVGLYRTYVYIPADEEFTYDSWCRNLRLGRTFMTAGPIIRIAVEDSIVGDTLRLPPGGGTVEVHAWAESIFPIHTLQLVERGRVIASAESSAGTRRLELRERVKLTQSGWLAARAGGPDYEIALRHRDVWQRGIIAHTSPIYVTCDGGAELFDGATAEYMLTLIDGSLTHIRRNTLQFPPGTTTHWHGSEDHFAALEAPFLEAREAIHRRLHRLGIPH
jgi:hypothetical protein